MAYDAIRFTRKVLLMVSKDNGIIAIVPVSEKARRGIPYKPYPDSIVIKCPGCQEDCWIGPESRKKAKKGFPIRCMVCIVTEAEPGTVFRTHTLSDK